MRTVVVFVEGGNVTEVVADGEVDVILHDRDNINAGGPGPVEFPATQCTRRVQDLALQAFECSQLTG